MVKRSREALWALLRALDILGCTIWLAPLYIVGLADRPTGRMMVSTYVGKALANGHQWARCAAWVIDRLAMLCGDQPNHCARSWEKRKGEAD